MGLCGEKLLSLRQREGLTQKEVAVQLHLERSCYTYYELGRSNPSYRSLLGLARVVRSDGGIPHRRRNTGAPLRGTRWAGRGDNGAARGKRR